MCIAMILSFAACAKNENNERDNSSGNSSVTSGDNSTPQELIDYVNAAAEQAESMGSNDLLTCEVEARGNAFVYKYTYKSVDEMTTEGKDAIEKSLKDSKDILDGVLSTMQKECSAIKSLIYEYYETDGDLIIRYEVK